MIDLVIEQRRRDLGGFEVGRVLPFAQRRMVGPFVFFDHMSRSGSFMRPARQSDFACAMRSRCRGTLPRRPARS